LLKESEEAPKTGIPGRGKKNKKKWGEKRGHGTRLLFLKRHQDTQIDGL